MNIFKRYSWFFYWFSAALLIAFGVTTIIENQIVLYAFACLFIIFGLFRVVPLVKTTESKLIKWLTVAEILVEIFSGVALFIFVEDLQNSKWFGYIIGGILYLRGFMHFFATSIKGEPTTIINFLVNIFLITIATIIIMNGNIDPLFVAIFFGVILLVCSLILIWRGYKDYRNYRGNLVSESKTKKIKVSKEKEVETNPTSDEIKINIVPKDEEDKRPSTTL